MQVEVTKAEFIYLTRDALVEILLDDAASRVVEVHHSHVRDTFQAVDDDLALVKRLQRKAKQSLILFPLVINLIGSHW